MSNKAVVVCGNTIINPQIAGSIASVCAALAEKHYVLREHGLNGCQTAANMGFQIAGAPVEVYGEHVRHYGRSAVMRPRPGDFRIAADLAQSWNDMDLLLKRRAAFNVAAFLGEQSVANLLVGWWIPNKPDPRTRHMLRIARHLQIDIRNLAVEKDFIWARRLEKPYVIYSGNSEPPPEVNQGPRLK